jgi:hypothetical protein
MLKLFDLLRRTQVTNIKTTRIYARITDDKIKNDMAMLAGKLKEMKTKYAENL